MNSGIYIIQCIPTSKVYVGSSIDVYKRFISHKSKLNSNKHANRHLQSAWNKYGESEFSFGILEHVPRELLLDREKHWMDFHESMKFGFNLISPERHEVSEETRMRMSDSHKGVKLSERHIASLSAARKGRVVSKEHREALSRANKGQIVSQEQRDYLSNLFKGRKMSDETKKKMSDARKGDKNHFFGKPLSEEHKEKLSVSHKGKVLSQDTKDKLSARLLEYHRIRRSHSQSETNLGSQNPTTLLSDNE